MIVLLNDYDFSLISTALFTTTLVALIVFVFLWQRRTAVGAFYLALFELAIAEWSLAAAFEAAALSLPNKIIWGQIAYLGITISPLLFFLFALEYTHQSKNWTKRSLLLLALIPTVTFMLAITNGWHQWLWPNIYLHPDTNLVIYEHGIWFWVFVIHTYTLITLGMFNLYRGLRHFSHFYRSQFIALLIASIMPFTGNIIYLSGISPIPALDWTPITFTVTGIILTWAIFNLQFFNLMPIARTQLIENMVDSVVVLDINNRIVNINPSAQKLLSQHDAPLLGQAIEQLIPEWTSWDISNQNALVTTQIEVEQPNSLTMDMRISPLYDKRNRFLGRLVILHDMSQHKQMEDVLRHLNATLEAQVDDRTADILAEKEKVETILRTVDDAILLADLDFQIQFVNKAYTKFTGFTAAELLGKPAGFVGLVFNTQEIQEEIKSQLAKGTPWQGDVTGQRKDGRFYDASLIISPVHDGSGHIIGYVSSHKDISQRKALERARNQFLHNVSHELRTPVSNIKLYTQLLRANRNPEKSAKYVETLEKQSDRLESLIKQFLKLAQIDSGMGASQWEPISFDALIHELISQNMSQATKKSITLTHSPTPPHLPMVMGDPSRLIQALTEILDNAITFTGTGGQITIVTETITQADAKWVTIAINDSGPGIPEDEQTHIFERFYRGSLAESGHIPGSGLGLNIVKEIMLAHGGYVTVQSTPETGTCFTLWLPSQ